MKLIDIAKEYVDLNVFNPFTQSTILNRAELFSARTGVEDINDITLETLATFKRKTLHSLNPIKPVTYNGYLRYLRIVGDYAVAQHLIQKNLFREIRLAPVTEPRPKTMSQNEILDICNCILSGRDSGYRPGWFWLTVICVFYYTGMRRRQLVTLRLSDLIWSDDTITSIQLRAEGSKTLREWQIPVHPQLANYLKAFLQRSEMELNRSLRPDDYLFEVSRFYKRYKEPVNGRMNPTAITGFFKRLSRNTGVPVGAHRFRHTFATTLCNPPGDGFPDVFAVQAILGHTNLQTTRRYVQTKMRSMDNALRTMGALFSSEKTTHLTTLL
ncbi:tyrosine-type recombinase/integrase [Cellvibrio zantedeschiae]|uniref:tyrosine-type recombinase/integrase n=1 Tax=Cellvibrio zantedeschiae TaxID=1237077 RepID=UPI001675DC4D|nr:site-specific integrase [Cellvibrio zantedeschiae]